MCCRFSNYTQVFGSLVCVSLCKPPPFLHVLMQVMTAAKPNTLFSQPSIYRKPDGKKISRMTVDIAFFFLISNQIIVSLWKTTITVCTGKTVKNSL